MPSFVPKDLELKSKIHLGVLCLCRCRLISVQIHPHIRKLLPEVRDEGVGVLTHIADNLATFRGKNLGHLYLNLKRNKGRKGVSSKRELQHPRNKRGGQEDAQDESCDSDNSQGTCP